MGIPAVQTTESVPLRRRVPRAKVYPRLAPLPWILALVALLLSFAIAEQKWMYLIAVPALPLAILWPIEVPLGLFALLIPFDHVLTVGDPSRAVGLGWFLGVGAGGFLVVVALVGRRMIRPPSAAIWWTLLMMWGAATMLWATAPEMVMNRLPTAFGLLLLYLASVCIKITGRQFERISGFAVAGGIIGALVIFYEQAQGVFQSVAYGNVSAYGRAAVVVGNLADNPNDFASTLLLPASLALYGLISAPSGTKRIAWLAAVAITWVGLYETMSRGALFALLVMLGVYAARFPRSLRVSLPIAAVSLIVIALSPALLGRVEESFTSRAGGRFDIWQVAAASAPRYGLIGAGIDNFPLIYNQYAGTATVFRGFGIGSHNTLVQVGIELGLVGLVLFLLAVGSQFHDAWSLKGNAPGGKCPPTLPYEAACIGMLVMALSLDALWLKTFWLCWILLALAVRVQRERCAIPA